MNCINMAMFFPGRKVWGCMVLWWHLPFCWGGIFILDGIYLVLLCGWCAFLFPFFLLQSLSQPLWAVAVCGSKHLYGAVFVLFSKIGQGAGDLKGCRKTFGKGQGCIAVSGMRSTYIEKTYGGKSGGGEGRCRVSSRNIPCSRWQPCTVLPCR